MDDLELKVNGASYAGWKTARITRGIETIAGGFELSVSDRWNGQSAPWPIAEEDACSLLVNGETLITGFVDVRENSYNATDHSLSVSGRDATGALVDCSAVLTVWEFARLPLMSLAKKLAAQHAIRVSLDPSVKSLPVPPDKFTVDPGETSFEVIDRACRLSGVLPISDGQGGLVITRAGNSRADDQLVEGQNIKAASGRYDATGRFGKYIVSGQKKGTDDSFGLDACAIKSSSQDFEVKRTDRTLFIRPEGAVTLAYAKLRAQWEATVRAARGDTVSISVQGWTQSTGRLWPINSLVRVKSSRVGVDGDMLITQTAMTVDNSGTATQLTLRRPDAFLPQPSVSQNGSVWKEISKGV